MTTPTEAELELYRVHGTTATFATLDAALGRTAVEGESPLAQWYRAVSTTPIDRLSNDDLTCAVVQRQHLPATMIEALRRLHESPLMGQNFPGELIEAVARAPAWFWLGYTPLIATVRVTAERALAMQEIDAEARLSVNRFLERVGVAPMVRLEVEVNGARDVLPLAPQGRVSIGNGALASVRIPREVVALAREALIFDAQGEGVRLFSSDVRATIDGKAAHGMRRLLGGECVVLGPLTVRVLTD